MSATEVPLITRMHNRSRKFMYLGHLSLVVAPHATVYFISSDSLQALASCGIVVEDIDDDGAPAKKRQCGPSAKDFAAAKQAFLNGNVELSDDEPASQQAEE